MFRSCVPAGALYPRDSAFAVRTFQAFAPSRHRGFPSQCSKLWPEIRWTEPVEPAPLSLERDKATRATIQLRFTARVRARVSNANLMTKSVDKIVGQWNVAIRAFGHIPFPRLTIRFFPLLLLRHVSPPNTLSTMGNGPFLQVYTEIRDRAI